MKRLFEAARRLQNVKLTPCEVVRGPDGTPIFFFLPILGSYVLVPLLSAWRLRKQEILVAPNSAE